MSEVRTHLYRTPPGRMQKERKVILIEIETGTAMGTGMIITDTTALVAVRELLFSQVFQFDLSLFILR